MAKSMTDKKRYHTDPEYKATVLAERKAYRARNPGKYKEWQRADRIRNPSRWLAYGRKYQKLPEPNYPPPNACEICSLRSDKALCLDHDHVTGIFRGWICSSCNVGLGHFRDSPESLERAAQYLKRKVNG